ncbi:MAG: M48 family metalloprotease [Hyphomonas sp.]
MARSLLKYVATTAAAVLMAATASAQGLIRDAEIEETIRNWTDPILEVAGLQPADVNLYIINDPSLNAFVAGGQNIHLHTGLIIAAENPEQIKGVIGHETCHIACGHSVSRQKAASIASRPALVSIGLGILAIATGEGGAGAALIGSSQQFAALNFFVHTRSEEAMADSASIEYLAALGESPRGIVEFFENFRYQEVLSNARRYPYFRSHPLASDRIRNARQQAEETGLMDKPASEQTQYEYDMMRAKLIGFLETPNKVNREYPPSDTSLAARYAHAIAAMQASDITTSLKLIDTLIADEPDNPYFHELKSQVLFESGRTEESIPPIQRALELKPNQPLLLIAYARSLNSRGLPDDIKTAENALRDALVVEPNNGFAWAQLAINMEKQGRRGDAQLATAESAYSIGNIVQANAFAGRAIKSLERGTPTYRRADDILLITDPSNPDNRDYYRRAGQPGRLLLNGQTLKQ